MRSATLASRTFVSDDQISFACLTGDSNPIHMDPVSARRTQAGAVVVHGVHAVLWALDRLLELNALADPITSLKVQFVNFIQVGSLLELKWVDRDENSIRLELVAGGVKTTSLALVFGTRKTAQAVNSADVPSQPCKSDAPAEFDQIEQLAKLTGWMDLVGPAQRICHCFPHIVSAIGCSRVTAVALLSTLVGMICPGLHSLFAGFAVDLVDGSCDRDCLAFEVAETDNRFRMIRMNVRGGGIHGCVRAFLRWPPVEQTSLSNVRSFVGPIEFAGSTSLIVGGSRGLGALTAKILASGGGKVIITYLTGRDDAQRVTAEIGIQMGENVCRSLRYDVYQNAAPQLETISDHISHLYYFATSNIGRQKDGLFVAGLFAEFVKMYVTGFYDCCRYLASRGPETLTAFYPSSVFVERAPPAMAEYSMAKMAGETLCANINRAHDRVRTIVSRLPRLFTDQTATVLPMGRSDPLEVMLPIVRKVQSSPRGS
jgi:acyl dehydratase